MTVYAGTVTVDGVCGDHIILAPAYMVTKDDVDHIVRVITGVVLKVFFGG